MKKTLRSTFVSLLWVDIFLIISISLTPSVIKISNQGIETILGDPNTFWYYIALVLLGGWVLYLITPLMFLLLMIFYVLALFIKIFSSMAFFKTEKNNRAYYVLFILGWIFFISVPVLLIIGYFKVFAIIGSVLLLALDVFIQWYLYSNLKSFQIFDNIE